jgi:hypothetical protein
VGLFTGATIHTRNGMPMTVKRRVHAPPAPVATNGAAAATASATNGAATAAAPAEPVAAAQEEVVSATSTSTATLYSK